MTEKEFFERQTKVQINITLERYRQLNRLAKKNQIVFSGSSLAEQFPIREMLANRSLQYDIYNRGVSGSRIECLIDNIDTLILDLEPSKLFINIGSNDIGSEDYSEEKLFEKYTRLLLEVQERLPSCKIHVLSYYPVNPNKKSFLPDHAKKFMFLNRTNQNIENINEKLKNWCCNHDVEYIDTYTILLDEERLLEQEYTVEGIHLWPNAYDVILDTLLPFLG